LAKPYLTPEILLEAKWFAEVLTVIVADAELLVYELVESSIGCQLQIINGFNWNMVSH